MASSIQDWIRNADVTCSTKHVRGEMQRQFQFCTAAFGEPYRRVAEALISSFARHHDPALLHVFTDLQLPTPYSTRMTWQELTAGFPDYYQSRQNVFKFQLLRTMFDRHPDADIVWIDADSVVLDALPKHLKSGFVNVMALDREGLREEAIGNNRVVPSSSYATGNFYSVPSVECVDELERLMLDRLTWPDAEAVHSGDQYLLNHFVHDGGFPVNWLGLDGKGWFSTGCAVALQDPATHPDVHPDPSDGGIVWRGEPIVLFSPTKLLVDISLMNGFSSYPPALREVLRDAYAWGDLPPLTRLVGFVRRALVWDLPRRLRRTFRRVKPLATLYRSVRDIRSVNWIRRGKPRVDS
jgi:hypothetical protein